MGRTLVKPKQGTVWCFSKTPGRVDIVKSVSVWNHRVYCSFTSGLTRALPVKEVLRDWVYVGKYAEAHRLGIMELNAGDAK